MISLTYELMTSALIYEHNEPMIYLIGRDEYRERHITKVRDFTPYCYVPGTQRKDLFGRLVDRKDFATTGDVEFERRKHEFTDESDLPFDKYRYMIDKKIFAAWSVEDGKVIPKESIGIPPKIQYLDIETRNPKELLPRPEHPDFPIVAISNSNNYTDEIAVFALNIPETKLVVDGSVPNIFVFDDEIEMLKSWVEYTAKLDPDVPTGWNSNRFDLPYLINRTKKLKTNVLAGLSPFHKVELKTFGARSIPIIEGRDPVDMHDAYLKRSMASGQLPSYDFKYVVGLPVAEGGAAYVYEDYGDRIDDLLVAQKYETFLDYCCRDAIAAKRLDRMQGLFDFYWGLKKRIGLPLRDALENSRVIDMWCLRVTDVPLPTNPKRDRKKEKLRGAVVFEPKIGVHQNVALLDFSSMYPHLIMAHNLSPETKSSVGDIFLGPLPDGRTVRFASKPEGLLPKAVRLLMEEREVLRRRRRELEAKGRHDDPEYQLTKNNETIVKFLLCSFYGVMGFPAFRLFDLDVANAITFLGRESISLCREIIRRNGYTVIYGDTDSVFAQLKSSNWREGLILERLINERLVSRAVFRRANYPLEVKYEAFFRRLLFKKLSSAKEMIAAKKSYAGHLTIADGTPVNRLHIRGLAPRRSDSAEVTRKTMREFLRLTLLQDNPQGAMHYLREQYNKVELMSPMETFIPRGVHVLTPKSPWVRGMQYMMKNYKVVFREDKKPLLGYVKTTRGIPSTKEICIADGILVPEGIVIDWPKMKEKLFQKKFEGILAGMGYEWNEIASNQKQTRLL